MAVGGEPDEDTRPIDEQIESLIKARMDLYSKILRYHPIEINEVQDVMLNNGVLCSRKVLTDFLDNSVCLLLKLI